MKDRHILVIDPVSPFFGATISTSEFGNLWQLDREDCRTLLVKQVRAFGRRFYVADSSALNEVSADRFEQVVTKIELGALLKCEAF